MVNLGYEDTDLLMIITDHTQKGGIGGVGGYGGEGGDGGNGGFIGFSYTWSTQERDNRGNICTQIRVNQDFGESFKRRIQIRWPIETSILIGSRTISREEEGPFSFEIRNISSYDIGKTAEIPRILTVIIEEISLLKNDKEYFGLQKFD